MKKIILAGNAISAEIISEYLRQDARYALTGFAVDDEFVSQGTVQGGSTVALSALPTTFPTNEYNIIMAMGYNDLNRNRESMFHRLLALGYSIDTYVHPDAKVYTRHPLGIGSVVLPGAVIEPNARLGDNSMIWSNTTLAHHSSVGNHCWVAAGAVLSGQAKVLNNTFLGVNSTVVNDVTVEAFNIVGAHALISRSTKPHTVHLARSAEPFRYSSEDYVKHFGI